MIVFAVRNATIAGVEHVGDDLSKVRLKISLADADHLTAFETRIKESIRDKKVGNMLMSSDVLEHIRSGVQPELLLPTKAVKGACAAFMKDKAGPIEPMVMSSLCKGQLLEYAIIEPFKFWFINGSGSFTYRLRNLTVLKEDAPPTKRKAYFFDDE